MTLRFFADQCISNFIIQTLQHADHEVLRLRDYLPTDSPDPVVISKAYEILPGQAAFSGNPQDPNSGIRMLQRYITQLCGSTDEFSIPDDTRVLGTGLQPYKYPRYVIVLNTTRNRRKL